MTDASNDTGPGRRNFRWRIQDLIDLEYFLHAGTATNGEANDSASFPRARKIYLDRLRHLGGKGTTIPRRMLIKGWLDIRRESEAQPLPGSIYAEANRICQLVAGLAGLFAGIGLALSLLDYSGIRPLNVSVYMGAAVFSQILLLCLLVVVLSIRAATRSLVHSSVLVMLLGRLLSAVLLKVRKGVRLAGGKREALAAAAGLLRGRKRVYGSLFFWPVFILMQGFGVWFNIGLLGATLVKLSGSDVAFGWQSTLQISDRAVFHLVEALAIPWRWVVPPDLAHPSLEAIEGSRIILKNGIAALATGDLVSWWPFLCFSVLFYGLLPRLVLLISGTLVKRHLLARLRFDHGACNRLVRAMTSPVFSTAGAPVAASGELPGEASPAAAGKAGHAHGGFVALIPEDIGADSDGLEAIAARELSVQVTDRKIIGAGDVDDPAASEAIKAIRNIPGFAGVLVLQEAWQPPIQENLMFLKQLRSRLGETAEIVVGLIGKPGPETVFTAPREENVRIWRQRVDALGDSYLGVERLVSHD